MGIKFLVLMVVYGCDPFRTDTYLTLSGISGRKIRLIIWDNSPVPTWSAADECGLGGQLISTPENLGLSVIYNRVISHHLRDDEYLLLLDQDSGLPVDFLDRVEGAIQTYPSVDLFLPMVRANNSWVSPLTYFCGWGRYWRAPKVGLLESKRVSAINSGMVVSARYLKGDFRGYDERLRFYGTDTQFMVDYAMQRISCVAIDAVIEHDLSFFSSTGSDRCQKFLAMKSAYRWIYERHPWPRRFLVRSLMLLVSIKYAVKYRSFSYLSKS